MPNNRIKTPKKKFFFVDVFCVRPCVFLVKVQSRWSGEVGILLGVSMCRKSMKGVEPGGR